MSALEMIQVIGPAVAVYVAIRVDMAAMKVRLDHLERDLYPQKKSP
jgi:hypothetical protein